MYQKNEILSLIPARGGSKGVVKKNIRALNGQPLIAYSILDSLVTEGINDTYVSTDSSEIADVALRYGAKVPFLRPTVYAQDDSGDYGWIKHFLDWRFDFDICSYYPEYLVILRPTTPLRDPSLITNAINHIKTHPEASSLRSVEEISESPYKWAMKDEDYLKPLIGDNIDVISQPRQNFPIVYKPNGYVDIINVKSFIDTRSAYGKKILFFKTPNVPEIDSEEDLKYAEYFADKMLF